jgi:peptidoglycan lytic transglycosylase A
MRQALGVSLLLLLGACAAPPKPPPVAQPTVPGTLRPASFGALPGWSADDAAAALEAFVQGCARIGEQAAWKKACADATGPRSPGRDGARRFFETNFVPYEVMNADGTSEGLITGYYEPLLRGSRSPTKRYRYPVYGPPDDLIDVELGDQYPELKNLRLRGRLEGKHLVPYYTRADIENGRARLKGREILWVDDSLDLFFLQVQGSGRVQLPSGDTVRIGYADQNGHPYKAIGRVLVERGDLTLEQATLQGIRDWAEKNPARVTELLNQNASYVFFRELPAGAPGAIGSLGVTLTAGRSLAVDARVIAPGAPVFLATTWPGNGQPLRRLMAAQDTGGAIKGGVRADVFWGAGADAARLAGSMREKGRLWVLLPKGIAPEAVSGKER